MRFLGLFFSLLAVPNVPCGVESDLFHITQNAGKFVPNVPCGVESVIIQNPYNVLGKFLMYRVELKALP